MKRYLLLASVAGCLLNVGNAWAGIETDAQSATLTASVSLKSAHVLGGTTAINFGTLMLKRDQIPTDGSVVSLVVDGSGGVRGEYVQATSGETSRPSLTIDGKNTSDDPDYFENLGDVNITVACSTTYVSDKGCKISGADDDLEVYLKNPTDNEASITISADELNNTPTTSSLFSGYGADFELNVATTETSWEDLTLTNVSAFTVTMEY